MKISKKDKMKYYVLNNLRIKNGKVNVKDLVGAGETIIADLKYLTTLDSLTKEEIKAFDATIYLLGLFLGIEEVNELLK